MSRHLDMANEVFDRMFGTKRLPAIARPDDLDVLHHNNEAINEIKDSHERAEIIGQMPRMDYGTIAEVEADIKGAHDDDRR